MAFCIYIADKTVLGIRFDIGPDTSQYVLLSSNKELKVVLLSFLLCALVRTRKSNIHKQAAYSLGQ